MRIALAVNATPPANINVLSDLLYFYTVEYTKLIQLSHLPQQKYLHNTCIIQRWSRSGVSKMVDMLVGQ